MKILQLSWSNRFVDVGNMGYLSNVISLLLSSSLDLFDLLNWSVPDIHCHCNHDYQDNHKPSQSVLNFNHSVKMLAFFFSQTVKFRFEIFQLCICFSISSFPLYIYKLILYLINFLLIQYLIVIVLRIRIRTSKRFEDNYANIADT